MCRCPGPTCPLLLLRVATPVEAPAGGVHGPPSPRGLLCCYVLLPLHCSQPPGQLAAPPQGVHGRAEPWTQVFGPVGQAGSIGVRRKAAEVGEARPCPWGASWSEGRGLARCCGRRRT